MPMPPGVVSARVQPGNEPARDDWFASELAPGSATALAADARPVAGAVSGSRRFGIASPRPGSIFALDPDIPPAAQRVIFAGERGTWWLNGRRLGEGEQLAWAPWPGRHELRLVGRTGTVVQTVKFEVRGAALKQAVR
jgi:penicillin-binding protein 1C